MSETFEAWAVVELMGRVRLAGKLSEQAFAGTKFARLDIPHGEEPPGFVTQLYGAGAIYRITLTTEEVARSIARTFRPPAVEVVHPYRPLLSASSGRYDPEPDDWDEEVPDDGPTEYDSATDDDGPPPDESLSASRHPLIFIVNGQDVVVECELFWRCHEARDVALKQSGNTGRSPDEWELRDGVTGQLLDLGSVVLSRPAGDRMFLSLAAGYGGSGDVPNATEPAPPAEERPPGFCAWCDVQFPTMEAYEAHRPTCPEIPF